MNIRDNVTECMYCGGAVSPQQELAHAAGYAMAGRAPIPDLPGAEPDSDEEEEGGLSKILQPGEQVLIGALNVTVKKFFFHAYLTNQRIFLIDTQEKKLKVTAKDIPRQTIAGSSVESSESADPVLVLSLKSADEEVKTLKLVFVQSDTDRSAEIDEWVALLNNGHPKKKAPRRQVEVPEPEVKPETKPEAAKPARPAMERPVQRQQELHPARKPPAKQLEKQAPVKRLLSMYNVPDEEPEKVPAEPEPPAAPQPRRTQVRQVQEREIVRDEPAEPAPVPKPEVQSAMKVAMKSAMRPLQQPHTKPVRRTVASEPVQDLPPSPPRRPVVQEPVREKPVVEEEVATATPISAITAARNCPLCNFCPGRYQAEPVKTSPEPARATVPDRA
jgi:hypothetical protein